MERGPKHVIIKKGEHGAFMFTERSIFFAPAYPLESGVRSDRRRRFVRRRLHGISRAQTGDLSEANLRRAVVYGSAMGSFAVEKFSIERLLEITRADIDRARRASSGGSSTFEEELPA